MSERPADCGAAALAVLAELVGAGGAPDVPADASLLDLVNGARAIGLDARPVAASGDLLDALPLPLIAHLEPGHWVVVRQVTEDAVRLIDPPASPRRFERARFDRCWTGYALVIAGTPGTGG